MNMNECRTSAMILSILKDTRTQYCSLVRARNARWYDELSFARQLVYELQHPGMHMKAEQQNAPP